jgi:hypothetical protein
MHSGPPLTDSLPHGVRLIDLPVCSDDRGRLTALEADTDIPFAIERVYYLYDVPGGESRAGHAHHALQQVLIAVSGSFRVLVDDGRSRAYLTLNRPFQGLHLSHMVWREIDDFSSGAVCLVIASDHFDEADYIRDYAAFQQAASSR